MSFGYTISIDDEANTGLDNALKLVAQAAAAQWASVITGLGSLNIAIDVVNDPSIEVAEGGPGTAVPTKRDGSRQVYESGAASELQTGSSPTNGSGDIQITINAGFLERSMDFNTNEAAAIPTRELDGLAVLTHEMGHGLGIDGYRDSSTGALPSSSESTWDRLVTIEPNGSAVFTGAAAEAVYGGPVPVTTLQNGEQYFHLGNTYADPDASDLMNGVGLLAGQNYPLSDLDIGIMKDLGLDTYGSAGGSPLVDAVYYLSANPDVARAHVEAAAHYDQSGWHEGRNPDAFFSTVGYLASNPDVAAAGVDPLTHYDTDGWKEGRDPSATFDTGLYLLHNPDVQAAGIDPLVHYLEHGQFEGRQTYAAIGPRSEITMGSFDPEFYLLSNPDVAKVAETTSNPDAFAYQHYETYGWHEGRDPNAFFDVNGYLTANPDVKAAGVDPLTHYDTFGWKEGRNPATTFDTKNYLAAYHDVAAAGLDPLTHYLQFGAMEGRSTVGDGHFT